MVSFITQALILIKILPNMSEQEKKQQWIYDLLNAETKQKKRFRNNWSFLWPPSSPDFKHLDYAI